MGGTFSNPAEKYPALFNYALFRTYPYLLPSLTAASVAACGAIFGFFYLEEVSWLGLAVPPTSGERRADAL